MNENTTFKSLDFHKKNLKKCFEKLSTTQSYSTVFTDFVDFALLMLKLDKVATDFAELETRWTKKHEHELFADMYSSWAECCYDFQDPLGDIFMEYVSGGRNGQFFTPEPICTMMSLLTMPADLADGSSICDPACGSGRTLLSAARINRNLKFYAADNDLLCAKMTALNFIVNTMTGEVAHMDSLAVEHYKSWHISKIRVGTHYLPTYYVTGPGETTFIQKVRNHNSKVKTESINVSAQPSNLEFSTTKKGQFIMF